MDFLKVLVPEFSNETVKCFFVDMKFIRNHDKNAPAPFNLFDEGVDCTEGDNDAHHPALVPSDEYWVDASNPPDEFRPNGGHELWERRRMIVEGWDYPKAHAEAKKFEIQIRTAMMQGNFDEANRLFMEELALAPKYKSKSLTEAPVMKAVSNIIRKHIPITVRKNADGLEEIVLNSGQPDRGGDRVFPDGDYADWEKNPVVMWLHDYRGETAAAGIPLGTGTYIRATDDGLVTGPVNWLTGDAFVDRVHNAWDQKVLRAVSIGFKPSDDSKNNQSNEFGGTDYHKWKLLEYSIVPIPMDADALRIGKNFPDLVEHKENQASTKDELDYTLELIKQWDFNETNETIVKSIFAELTKRYPVTDITVTNKALTNKHKAILSEAIELCNKAEDLCNDHHKDHNACYKDLVAGITECRTKLQGLNPEKPEDEKPDEDEAEKLIHALVTK